LISRIRIFAFFFSKNHRFTSETQKQNPEAQLSGCGCCEPLKEGILAIHHAEKLTSSNDLIEIKSFAEKLAQTLLF